VCLGIRITVNVARSGPHFVRTPRDIARTPGVSGRDG
jgi:hypothetical protein